MTEYDPVDGLIVGSGELLLLIIIVGRLPECSVCVLDEVRGGLEGIRTSKITPLGMFINKDRGSNPR